MNIVLRCWKRKLSHMLFVLFFYRILKYAYLLRYIACLGYKKGLSSVLIMNGVKRLIVPSVLVISLLWIMGWGVCEGWGVLRGFGVPPWWLWGGGGGVENTQKLHRNHIKYKGEPLEKKLSQRIGGGVDRGYKSHQGEQIPLSRNLIPGPGALREEPYRPSWPLGPLYTVPFLFILSLKIVQMLIFACKTCNITFSWLHLCIFN